MIRRLDILMFESHPHAGDDTTAALEADGHTVLHCYEDPERAFPCRGLKSLDGCPLDDHVDVGVLVQRGRNPLPTELEGGVRCAIRAGLPIVETGAGMFDPFGPWVSKRVRIGGDVAQACGDVVERPPDSL